MFQEHVKKTYLIAWDQQIQPLEPYVFIASCKSPSGQTKYLQCGQHLTGLEKKLEFQLVLWANSSNLLLALGFTLLV